MSSAFDCCLPACPPGSLPSSSTVNIPGPQGDPGEPGAAGADGTDGKNAFTVTLADVLLPVQDNNVSVSAEDVSWMQIGQNVFMSGTEGVANFQVISKNDVTNFAVLKFLEYNGDLASGLTISAGAGISPSGIQSVPLPGSYFTAIYSTSIYALVGGLIIDEAHGLGGPPDEVSARLVCQTSEAGYKNLADGGAAGADELDVGGVWNNQTVFSYGANAEKVWLTLAANEPTLDANRKDTGAQNTALTYANWKVRMVAKKYTAA